MRGLRGQATRIYVGGKKHFGEKNVLGTVLQGSHDQLKHVTNLVLVHIQGQINSILKESTGKG